MALAAGTGYLVKLIYYVSIDTLKMVVQIPVPSLMALTSLMGIYIADNCIIACCNVKEAAVPLLANFTAMI